MVIDYCGKTKSSYLLESRRGDLIIDIDVASPCCRHFIPPPIEVVESLCYWAGVIKSFVAGGSEFTCPLSPG